MNMLKKICLLLSLMCTCGSMLGMQQEPAQAFISAHFNEQPDILAIKKTLADHPAYANFINDSNNSILAYAMRPDFANTVFDVLIPHITDIKLFTTKDSSGNTPLFDAIRHGSAHQVSALLAKEKEITGKDNPSVDIACKGKYDSTASTPLYLAAENKNPKIFNLLLQHGAQLSTSKTVTGLDYTEEEQVENLLTQALKQDSVEVVQFVLQQSCYTQKNLEDSLLSPCYNSAHTDEIKKLIQDNIDQLTQVEKDAKDTAEKKARARTVSLRKAWGISTGTTLICGALTYALIRRGFTKTAIVLDCVAALGLLMNGVRIKYQVPKASYKKSYTWFDTFIRIPSLCCS